ncbi:MFS transporter [Pseudomonas sp. H1h]|uniref:MFS transporter n=1 Tax=Pseudomonas sp. H1h TaxID=1397280 RepID=UPI00046A2F27|nr:MFS transporter [Pseudomonas sp. H1h]
MKSSSPGILLPAALLAAVIVPQLGLGLMTPTVAKLAEEFRVPQEAIQETFVVYMVGYALSVVLAGILADRIGPRRVQLSGLLICAAGCVLAAFSDSFHLFAIARFMQALGGCVGTVTTRLIVKSNYPESGRLRILTTLASAIALTPCIAPLLGGLLLPTMGWRWMMGGVAAFNFGALLLFWRVETSPGASDSTGRSIIAVYADNFKNIDYLIYAAGISLVWMSYFVFLSCSTYALQTELGMSSIGYGAVISLCAVGYVVGSTLARALSTRWALNEILLLGSRVGMVGCILLAILLSVFGSVLPALLLPMVFILLSVGMVIPATQAGLLKSVSRDIGISSGQFFFFQMAAGAGYGLFVSSFPELGVRALALFIAIPIVVLFVFLNMSRALSKSAPKELKAVSRT